MNSKNYFQLFLLSLLMLGLNACSKKNSVQSNELRSIPELKKLDKKKCPQLYLCLGRLPEESMRFAQKNDIEHVILITGSSIHNKDQVSLNKSELKAKIEKVFPNANSEGIGVLDWEGKGIHQLEKEELNSETFRRITQQYAEGLRLVKKLRPKVKWGYYSLPLRNYWSRDKKWEKRNEALHAIYDESDILFPSIYDFYHDEVGFAGRKLDSMYVNDNVELALRLGIKHDLEVIPFFWHRYHNSNKTKPLEIIPDEEFAHHISAAIAANYKGKHIDGLVWWGADEYYTKHKKVSVYTRELKKNKMTLEEQQNKLTFQKASLVHNQLLEFCNN